MSNLFSLILNMSMTGSVVILLVVLVRFLLKRSPKIFSYTLWSVVLFRLLCPVAFTAPVSVLNALEPEVQEASESTSVVYFIPAEVNQNSEFTFVPAENQSGTEFVQAGESVHTGLDLMTVVSYVWISGAAIMILYSIIQYIRLRMKLVGAMLYRGDVYLSDYIDTPFVMGILQPKIYLPSNVPTKERKYIIAHERHHVRRFDHIIKLLAYLALCIHWFNPLVWAAFILAGKDMEMSCDEAVIRKMGSQIRADYSASLLRLATHKKIIAGMPLAFGEGDTKGRVMNMARWKKPKLWVSSVCIVLCILILVVCSVNPKEFGGEVVLRNFHVTLPERFYSEVDNDSLIFRKGNKEVGGIHQLDYPKFALDLLSDPERNNAWEWVEALNVPENVPEERLMMWVEVPPHRDFSAAYGNGGKEETVHYFFTGDTVIYDLWIDVRAVSEDEQKLILESAHTEVAAQAIPYDEPESVIVDDSTSLTSAIEGTDIITDTELIQYGSLKLLLSPGFTAREQDGAIVLTRDSVDIGGITCWNHPGFEPDDMIAWMKALGIPELQEDYDVPIGYMAGNSAYGGWEIEIFWDGNPDALCEQHTFFIDGDIVYDVWYDENQISDGIAERFLKTVAINADPVVVKEPGEQEAFAKCRAVLDVIQNGSCHILIEEPCNDDTRSRWSTSNYYQDNGNWLIIEDIDPECVNIVDGEQYSLRIAYMAVNGVRYSNEGKWGKAYTDIEWREDDLTFDDSVKPWLASFQWDDSVAYMDTLTDENGECVMLRVDEKHSESDEAPHYFLFFNFDADGSFVNVELQVNLFLENEYTITESIVSLDPETVNAEIQKEYQRAVG